MTSTVGFDPRPLLTARVPIAPSTPLVSSCC